MNDQQLLESVVAKANIWLGEGYDADIQEGVKELLESSDKSELIESFYRDLEFGTGGLRGIMGVGSNRMNKYTVGSATQGLANYLKEAFADLPQISVVVGHDVRNNSRKFAEIVADIFSANGIKVYLFDSFRPTPEISFAIRELGCQSGVIITASHNPKEYNGYKAYWNDGGQIIAPHDTNIIDYVNKITEVSEIQFTGKPENIQIIGKDIDDIYLAKIKTLSLSPDVIERQKDIKIVYTPIHGTGKDLVPESLKMWGFTNIINVPEQDIPDGNFPTVKSPNPEEPSAMAMAIAKAEEVDADIIMATDPDADRIGIVIKDNTGKFVLINGNQIQLIFLNYIMTRNNELGMIKGDEYIAKTIVTTELIKTIADAQNIKMFDCYTGFKWIAAIIRENEGKGRYLGGGEESYGFLGQDFVRDKDAVSAASIMGEIAAWSKDKGLNMYDMLQEIYCKYGFSKELGISLVRQGKSGAEEIVAIMNNLRTNPPKTIAGSPVEIMKDYKSLELTNFKAATKEALVMPTTSDVLQFFTEDGTKVSVRPSGTEPKIKFYIEVKGEMANKDDFANADATANAKVEIIKKDFDL
ncbi:MAG: phospho-sugar mutase [Bacteroidales bacterium]